ncbi:polysaccharide pyruvyl transferase family protein [Alistipes provencensis]|uniref:polysaccharide pyruvyl transferase family protein n=1 Tax=Alistipes provencensis TaxID=1816676 RepID=UPI0007ECD0D1|nr:polysaccharide pyruvyl transferase family protein [Alistipes provencensis]
MTPLRLIFWYYKNWGPNYGDWLSPYIISRLTGRDIQQCFGNGFPVKYAIKNHIKKLLGREYDMFLFPWEQNIIAIGSIMSRATPSSRIWGTGILDPALPVKGGYVYAVRGRLTLQALKEKKCRQLRFQNNIALGDPGILIPLFIKPAIKKHELGLIPHFSEIDYFKDLYDGKIKIIDLRSEDVKAVTDEISSCRKIISTSLHGLIVAHSYGIPAIWIEHEELHKGTSGFKFRDYFSSVDIPEYTPLHNIEELINDSNVCQMTFDTMATNSLPQKDIRSIQQDLLDTVPFNILGKWKDD